MGMHLLRRTLPLDAVGEEGAAAAQRLTSYRTVIPALPFHFESVTAGIAMDLGIFA
jgi:hypothetical protein